ncbi:hypothetical protein [uncultured Phyllobacterium sp.]|uniref:hypothetical protein n=1 Tax=uncultured Phyllobacterium sp. TaxID=253813 RepID=UPI0025864A12|nr:hypothetical protein [uncultured Phyllobacterium sp.]
MISVSSHVWENMGYRKLDESESLRGSFYRLLIYHIEGFKTDQPIVGPLNHIFEGQFCSLAIGGSVNEACRTLATDELVDDEEEWRKRHSMIGPYLVLKIGPTAEYKTTATHLRNEGNEIWTNGGFDDARAELDELQERIAPLVVSSLTVAFSIAETVFRFVEAVNYGVARDGKRIRDVRFSLSAYAIVSMMIAADEVRTTVLNALGRSSHLDRNVAGFYDLGLKETDPTKQFLLFFITLELLTKTEFAKRYPLIANSISGAMLPKKERNALAHQFSWLQKHALTSLSQQCVDRFQQLRQTRNLIAHGAIVSADPQDVVDVKTLATTIIAAATGFPAR